MSYRRLSSSALLVSAIWLRGVPLAAQLPSNATLQGTYYFRYLGVNSSPSNKALSALGSLSFDGNGKVQVTAQQINNTAPGSDKPLNVSTTVTYSVVSSGAFTMGNPFTATGTASTSATLFGGVGAGVVVASSTDSAFCDLFVAIPASTTASTATLSGTYQFASLEFLNGDFASSRDTFFPLTPDGKGALGNVAVKGTAINLNNQPTTQTSTGATYSVSANGSGTVTFPAPAGVAATSQLLTGTKTLYVSSDGNLILGGSATGYDMFLGIKALSGSNPTPLSGVYFTGLLENDASTNGIGLYASEGAANEVTNTLELAHERANNAGFAGYDFTYSDGGFGFKADGTVSLTASQYAAGAGGNLAIGAGNSDNYQLALYVKGTPLSGTGVFLNPRGVVNAANNIPFTAQVSPGELIVLNGTGLYSGQLLVASSLPFPTQLGGVKATVSWTVNGATSSADMPLYYVSPTAIAAIVPYGVPTDGSYLSFLVNNNGSPSNSVLSFSGITQPGVFTLPPGGVGNGAILHADFSLVSTASPAKIGETVQIFLTGLGPVNPPVAAGAAGPTNPLSVVSNLVDSVFVDGTTATAPYQGLAPQLAGLYQLNVNIPHGVTTGSNVTLEIVTTDADNLQATIPIGK
jgi:uncharacterized protein (TIGR03437 family)